MTDEQRAAISTAIAAMRMSGWDHRVPVLEAMLQAARATPADQLDMSLEAQLADAKADVKRLHAEKMEWMDKWIAVATPADQVPVLGKDVWEYSFMHSSALGRPDEKVTMLTYEKADAFKPECFDQKLVCSVGMFVAEVSQDSDGFKHIADVVELDDIPAGTKLYAITAGNLFTVPQPEAQKD